MASAPLAHFSTSDRLMPAGLVPSAARLLSRRVMSHVFCYQSGHDNVTWADPNFQEVLRRGILWSADKL